MRDFLSPSSQSGCAQFLKGGQRSDNTRKHIREHIFTINKELKVNMCSVFPNLKWVTLYFTVSMLQCNYTFKYQVILINYMYLLYG